MLICPKHSDISFSFIMENNYPYKVFVTMSEKYVDSVITVLESSEIEKVFDTKDNFQKMIISRYLEQLRGFLKIKLLEEILKIAEEDNLP